MLTIRRIAQIDFDGERFWEKVDKSDTCWLWTAARNPDGYGKFGVQGGVESAHRWSWQRASGETLTPHDTICHTCDVPNCVRNDDEGTYRVGRNVYPRRGHLYKATQPVNVADRDEKGRGHWATEDANGMRLHPEAVPRGSLNGNSFISEADVVAIRERYARGANARELAATYGFADPSPIFGMVSRTSWGHVPGPSYAEIKSMRARVIGPSLNSRPCIDCGTTERKRIAKGLCEHCYSERARRAKGILPALGMGHHAAKLSDDDVRAIRSETHYGMGRVLARRFGVSPATISNIQSGKKWSHVI